MVAAESGEQRVSLVTGGCGFMGRHLVALLSARGDRVRVLDLRDWPNSPSLPLPANVEMRQGSILDKAALSRASAGVDRVFHLAANPNLWAAHPATFHEINFEGTCRVIDAASAAGVSRFVYTST